MGTASGRRIGALLAFLIGGVVFVIFLSLAYRHFFATPETNPENG